MNFTCARCGKTFAARADRKAVYCSFACRSNQVTRACEVCGTQFSRKASLAGPFCSRACSEIGQGRRTVGPEKQIEQVCPGCGDVFTTLTYRQAKFCSAECRHRSALDTTECPTCSQTFTFWKSWPRIYCSNSCAGKMTITNIANFAPSSYQARCEWCSHDFMTTPKRSRGRFCSRKCWAAWMEVNAPRGENAPNWRGGYDPYYGPSWRAARRAVRRRDNVCQRCGITPQELGKNLDVHHVVPFRAFGRDRHLEANQIDNLVGLCPICHITVEWETNWVDKFKPMPAP